MLNMANMEIRSLKMHLASCVHASNTSEAVKFINNSHLDKLYKFPKKITSVQTVSI